MMTARVTVESWISETIHLPAIFAEEQAAVQERILQRIHNRTGLDLHHRDLAELSTRLQPIQDNVLTKLSLIVSDCAADEGLDQVRKLERLTSVAAIIRPMPKPR